MIQLYIYMVSLVVQAVKNLPAVQKTQVWFLGWRREWQPTPVFLPGTWGYTVRGVAEPDVTERLTWTNIDCDTHTHILSHILFHYGLSQDVLSISLCHCWALLLIHLIYNSLHLLTPNSHCIPSPPHLLLGNHKSVLYACESREWILFSGACGNLNRPTPKASSRVNVQVSVW